MQEEQIIQIMKDDNQAGFKLFVDHYKSTVEQFAFQYGIENEDLQSIVQDVFIKLFRKINRIEVHNASILLHQSMVDSLKGLHKKESIETYKRYGYYFDKKEHMIIQHCLQGLDDKYKLPIILYYFHKCTLEDISLILKVKSELLKTRLDQGIKVLEEKCRKIMSKETTGFPNVKMEEFLILMIYNYERLPRFTDTAQIMLQVNQVGKTKKWRKNFPILAGVVGLIVFSVFAITYIQAERERQVSLEQEKADDKVENNQGEIATSNGNQDLDPEILANFEEAKVKLSKELGIEDVDRLSTVTMVEGILNEVKSNPSSYGSDDTKYFIDTYLTPPSKIKEQLNPSSQDVGDTLMTYLYRVVEYQWAFQDYLDQLLMANAIDVDDYDTILLLQEDPSSYEGPEKIIELFQALEKQGYTISRETKYDKLTVTFDYDNLINYMEELGFEEGYTSYVLVKSKHANVNWSEWEKLDEYALELEELLIKYGDSYRADMRNMLISDIENFLYNYLKVWEGNSVTNIEREEYFDFLANHKGSTIWEVVNSTVLLWEKNDWDRIQDGLIIESLRFLYQDRYQNVDVQNILRLDRWPYTSGTSTVYDNYSTELNIKFLLELTPSELVSLYAYSTVKDDDTTASSLLSLEGSMDIDDLYDDWLELRNMGAYVLTEFFSENESKVYYVDWEGLPIITIDLEIVDGVWKISHIQ
ncbi:RNA polymerase sigma factor [Ornithinibacillus sp. 179-J 7C1 HS]|uniref:RNA polymerase sigma factor n=1 Tax=Ornithinibacillus sp. 179-J 7C1 HS TaxID=3142384 RepID=UPI0039A39EBE